MGVDTRRPPLPAPTETETDNTDHDNHTIRDELATNLSTRTDKTSYSIPEDGTPVTINTAKKSLHRKHLSQTSLLIEYFEGGKDEGKVHSRPSVRVRVTPSSRKNKSSTADRLQITQRSRTANKPSYTHHISLPTKPNEVLQTQTTTNESYSESSNVSSLPPVEIEVLQNASDLSSNGGHYVPQPSDISSMPADSMLNSNPVILPPPRRRSRSLDREEVLESMAQDNLQAPTRQRSRSLSKERITQRVMEKLQQTPTKSTTKATRSSREDLTPSRKSRRTSRGSRDDEYSAISGTESSLLSSNANAKRRSGDTQSMRSGVSGTSSINNPKLLATVEDAIKRLILPEITALKEQQHSQSNRDKFDRRSGASYETVDSTSSRDHSRRRVSKSSSAPHIHGSKPKVVLNRDGDDPGTVLSGHSSRKGERRSSRSGSVSERSVSVSKEEERSHRRRSKDKDGQSTRDAAVIGLGAAGLTAAALRHHESREESKEERRERRRHRSSRSRTASISESVEEDHRRELVPPFPLLQSELHQASEMTRDSILSAETETRSRRSSISSGRTGTGAETPLQEVARGYALPASPSPRTPTRTPAALQRSLGTAHGNLSRGNLGMPSPKGSERSLSSRSREVSSAALEAAAAAKARAIESPLPQASQYEIAAADKARAAETPLPGASQDEIAASAKFSATKTPLPQTPQYEIDLTPTRGLSPIQSEASYQEEVQVSASPRHVRSSHSAASVSTSGQKLGRQVSDLSIRTFESSSSTKEARTRKRPQGVNLERTREILGEPGTPGETDEFFEKNHEQNEMYRREIESQAGSPHGDYRMSNYTEESADQYYDNHDEKMSISQDIRKVGSNPEYVHTPLAVESNVASLIEPSTMSGQSSLSSPIKKSRLSQVSPVQEQYAEVQEHPAQERWAAIRGHAQALAEQSHPSDSPRQSLSQSVDENPKMHASAFPTHGEMMPEIGYMDDESEISTNPSIIKGPLGGAEYRAHSDELLSRQEERENTPSQHSYSKGAAIGVGAGAAAIAAAAAAKLRDERSPSAQHEQYQASVSDEYDYPGEHHYAPQPNYAQETRTPSRSPAMWKDEGYQSANQPGGITPDLRNRSKMFDDDGLGEYDEDDGLGGAGLFDPNGKHARHLSGNSHGMTSPLYDSATGKGVDRIQSKDVVALMDHLTVRDAQRNARDTEILVTLVRSAAEMRNSFEEMKQFIRTQDAMIMNQTDKRVDLAEQRLLQGPRPQPLGSPRVPRSSSEDIQDVEQKRKSVFKRALKGLSLKGDNDIKKIEGMLIQLLGEVEGLKAAHEMTLAQQNNSRDLTSYENLRASGDPGYEPEGRAGTASSPNHSGYLSNPSSRRVQDMHSGFDVGVHQPHRISTVEEDDEEYEDDDRPYDNTERMTTPTQEARRSSRNNSIPEVTPPQATRQFRESQSQENTPKRKHKSNSSSIFGIPKISRWSKTTASTNRDSESLPRNSGSGEKRPYSAQSRSTSQVNVAYYGEEDYEPHGDDRLNSSTSLAREEQRSIRSPSPLIPEEDGQYVLDDPKYQAHRNSLNLQHPQPRPGPTGRHQNHLESQAQIYEPLNGSELSNKSSVHSPDYDQWGSNPALARNRLSNGGASLGPGNLSPISSGGYSNHSAAEQAAAPPRPPKIRDDGPLIPPQPLAGHGQTRQMYSAQNEYGTNSQGALTPLAPIQEVRYSLETDTGHHYSPSPSPRPNTLNPAMANPQRKITGPRPMGSRSPSGRSMSDQGLQHSDTVVRRKPVVERDADLESLESYRSSLDSETF